MENKFHRIFLNIYQLLELEPFIDREAVKILSQLSLNLPDFIMPDSLQAWFSLSMSPWLAEQFRNDSYTLVDIAQLPHEIQILNESQASLLNSSYLIPIIYGGGAWTLVVPCTPNPDPPV